MSRRPLTCQSEPVAVVILLLSGLALQANSVKLRCKSLVNPLGIDIQKPTLSCSSDNRDRNWKQSAYEILVASTSAANSQAVYEDGRPSATLRIEARDQGVVLRHGNTYDALGARDVWVYASNRTYFMHYDAAGPTGWLCALATSRDLIHWKKMHLVLDLGKRGDDDSGSASYCVTYRDVREWQMFYLGTPHTTPPADRIPLLPYLTLKAHSTSPYGPWMKEPAIVPFRPKPNTYYATTASPGAVIRSNREYLQFFSASVQEQRTHQIKRTIGIARTKNLDAPWSVNPVPIVPLDEQIENASLYFEPTISTWFLFTNHIGISNGLEYTDAIWVYWTKDLE